jgi:drug/metabolite transporter (DMT)-like permease
MSPTSPVGSAGLPGRQAGGRPGGLVDWTLLVLPGVIWGASFLFIAEGLEAMAPNGITFCRIAIGFLTLSMIPSSRRPIARRDWLPTALLGVLWMAFPLSMFPFAEQRVSSALTGMLNGAMPLFAAMVASIIARRPPSRGIATGLAVGVAGAVLVALPSVGQRSSSLVGVLLIVVALASYGIAVNLARPLQQRNGALPVIWRAQVVGLILTAPLGLPDLLAAHWTRGPLFSMLALGALGTGVAFVLTTMASGRIGATRASATAFLMPPVALLLGVSVRGEHVAALSIVGGAVCIAGAWLIRRDQVRQAALETAFDTAADRRISAPAIPARWNDQGPDGRQVTSIRPNRMTPSTIPCRFSGKTDI